MSEQIRIVILATDNVCDSELL